MLSCEWYSSIIKDIHIFSQNICKNNFIINIIFETQFSFDIIFIQELSWSYIQFILSSNSFKRRELISIPNHSNWTMFSRNPAHADDSPRVITYINIYLSLLCFALYKDISLIFFFNNNSVFYLMNIYSDSFQVALKYLKNTEINIQNILVMTSDFNIRDSL